MKRLYLCLLVFLLHLLLVSQLQCLRHVALVVVLIAKHSCSRGRQSHRLDVCLPKVQTCWTLLTHGGAA